MRYLALATDYDGTLAHHGVVDARTVDALKRLQATGRRLLLVTGRELDELLGIFPEIDMFDRVVAENGALLYRPATRERKVLGKPPPERFLKELERRGVPISVGASIVATVEPHEVAVLEVIRDLGLELKVIFNKGAVMVLPADVNKASGLRCALEELGLSHHNVVAVGDAENDHALLDLAEYSAAVANAVPLLKEHADRTLLERASAGVVELIEAMITNDLAMPAPSLARRRLVLGTVDGDEVAVPPARLNILVAGSSGSGKSTFASGILERLCADGYQFCVVDPEGDYEAFEGAIVLGGPERAPSVQEVATALEKIDVNVVVNLVGLPLADRPAFFQRLLPHVQELRSRTGRPHWILVDETHHLLPTDWQSAAPVLAQDMTQMIFVTVHPEWIAPAVLAHVDAVATIGDAPADALEQFCRTAGSDPPAIPARNIERGEAMLWIRSRGDPVVARAVPSTMARRRHRRKYAEGELPPERSFWFRGPQGKLKLRAQNLILFTQIGEGVDDETWLHHLRAGDYSKWLREAIKDDALAEEVANVERDAGVSAAESRERVKRAIEGRYTLPEEGLAKATIPAGD